MVMDHEAEDQSIETRFQRRIRPWIRANYDFVSREEQADLRASVASFFAKRETIEVGSRVLREAISEARSAEVNHLWDRYQRRKAFAARLEEILPGKWAQRLPRLFRFRIKRFKEESLFLAGVEIFFGLSEADVVEELAMCWPWQQEIRKKQETK